MSHRTEGARRLYRVVLRAFPGRHRDRYGDAMEDAFLTLLERARRRRGLAGVVACWARAVLDAAIHGAVARGKTMTNGGGGRHEGGGMEMMGTIASDTRFAIRSMLRRPVFAVTAVLTLAIGIGANASIFTLVDGFLITPLPYDEPDELVVLFSAHPELGWSGIDVNLADAWDWRERASTIEDIVVFNDDAFNLTGDGTPERVFAIRVSPNFLSLLGRAPAIGRDFTPSEVGPGRDDVAILTDGFWERRFGRDPEVLGSTLRLDGDPVRVIGILPADFLFHDGPTDLYRPWSYDLATAPRGSHSANAIARLAAGTELTSSLEELRAVSRDLEVEHPQNSGWTVEMVPLKDDVLGDLAKEASLVLMGAVGFILLMACVNVANLLLASAEVRSTELGVRMALGAGRRRVVRQLLTESLVLAVMGGVLGLIGAVWGSRAIVAILPPTMPPVLRFEMGATVVAFTAAITLGSAIVFGVLPAVRASDFGATGLRGGTRAGRSRSASRFGGALVVVQTALAVVLLVSGGLLMKSVSGLRHQDFGFEPQGVLTARISPPESEYPTPQTLSAYWSEVVEQVGSLPTVTEVGTTQSHPLMGSNWGRAIRVAGRSEAEDESIPVRLTLASHGLFEALRFRMDRGRTFRSSDGPGSPSVAIVNRSFVDRYLEAGADPLGQRVTWGENGSAEIVGVVHDIVERDIDNPPEPALYLSIDEAGTRARSLVLRTTGDPSALADAVRNAVWAVDADVPLSSVRSMEDQVDRAVGGFAALGYLMGVFALLSLVLGAVGIYGVTAYSVGRRRSEIGVRIAMGARPRSVMRLVVRQGMMRSLLGVGIGLGLALGMGRVLSSVLVGVSPRDPVTYGIVVAAVAAISFLGLYLPARSGSRVDPVHALSAP